jgi:DNA-binding winged helix-turn-helix (wHTH) protein
MTEFRLGGPHQRGRRRWVFADCVFDEADWALVVNDQRVSIESKPLELLRELLNRAGDLLTKDELLDGVWPDVTVVEASLTTAVRKLRIALNDEQRPTQIIETVPRIGYRLNIPVEVEDSAGAARISWSASDDLRRRGRVPATKAAAGKRSLPSRPVLLGSCLIIIPMLTALAVIHERHIPRTQQGQAQAFTQRRAADALRRLDVPAIEAMLAAGWNPNTPFDKEGNAALNYVLNECEWDRGHDKQQMVLMVRTLFEAGAKLDHRNVWGDTPYSIAKAVRYCGPDHPVTRSIRAMCYAGLNPLGDRCLASYEMKSA